MNKKSLSNFKDAIDCTGYLECFDKSKFNDQDAEYIYNWFQTELKDGDIIDIITKLINTAYQKGYQQGQATTELLYKKKKVPLS